MIRCMCCDRLTDNPIESKRPEGNSSSILVVMVCPDCRGSQAEFRMWTRFDIQEMVDREALRENITLSSDEPVTE